MKAKNPPGFLPWGFIPTKGLFMFTFTRIALLGLLLLPATAFAEKKIPQEDLRQIGQVSAFTNACTEKGFVDTYTFVELNDIILKISYLPSLDMEKFIEYRLDKQMEIAVMDTDDLIPICNNFRKSVIRVSMSYWTLYKEYKSE